MLHKFNGLVETNQIIKEKTNKQVLKKFINFKRMVR